MNAANALLKALLVTLVAIRGYSQELLGAKDQFLQIPEPEAQAHSSLDARVHIWNESTVAGYYRGLWHKQSLEGGDKELQQLYKSSGALFLHIQAEKSHAEGLLNIQGEAVLRDGERYSEEDILFSVKGLFVTANQRLHAVLESSAPSMQPDLDASDYEEHTPAYSLPKDARCNREALRNVYTRWRQTVQSTEGLPFHFLELENPMVKKCEFMLDLAFEAPAERHGENSTYHSLNQVIDTAQEEGVHLNGSMHSQVCRMSLSLNGTMTHPDAYFSKATNYALMIISLTFLQTMLLLRQIECSNTQAQMSSVNLLMIGQQAIMDAYLCLLHLTTGMMVESLFNAMATAAFFEFVIFAVFEMRYMLNIWKSRQGNLMDSRAQQRELLGLYARFYFALLSSIFITYQAQRFVKVLVFLAYSFWVPQIVSTAYQDTRQPLRPFYLLGISASRMVLPLYIYGCPDNILQMPVSPGFCMALSAFMTLQVCVLVGQQMLGSRFFIPRQFLPPKYDYFRKCSLKQQADLETPRDVETGDAGLECVICMNPVDVEDHTARMLTPCNHVFHTACLQRWMIVKMECPTCRSMLPPE